MNYKEAADELELNPIRLAFELGPFVSNFEECYPQVDDGLVETIAELGVGTGEVHQEAGDE